MSDRSGCEHAEEHVALLLLLNLAALDARHRVGRGLSLALLVLLVGSSLGLGSVSDDVHERVDPRAVRSKVGDRGGVVVGEDVEAVGWEGRRADDQLRKPEKTRVARDRRTGGGDELDGQALSGGEEREQERGKGKVVDSRQSSLRRFTAGPRKDSQLYRASVRIEKVLSLT